MRDAIIAYNVFSYKLCHPYQQILHLNSEETWLRKQFNLKWNQFLPKEWKYSIYVLTQMYEIPPRCIYITFPNIQKLDKTKQFKIPKNNKLNLTEIKQWYHLKCENQVSICKKTTIQSV